MAAVNKRMRSVESNTQDPDELPSLGGFDSRSLTFHVDPPSDDEALSEARKLDKDEETKEPENPLLRILFPKPAVEIDKPLPLSAVVSVATKTLAAKLKRPCCNYMIAGSYPSALAVFEASQGKTKLPYNDVDIFFCSDAKDVLAELETDRVWRHRLLKVTSEEVMIGGKLIELNFINTNHAEIERLIQGFDINCIRIGYDIAFKWVPCYTSNPNDDGASPVVTWSAQAEAPRKYTTPDFDTWCKSMAKLALLPAPGTDCNLAVACERGEAYEGTKLQLAPFETMEGNPASAVLRILRKSRQLGLGYSLPKPDVVARGLHQRCIAEKNRKIILGLDDAARHFFRSHFTTERIENWIPKKQRLGWKSMDYPFFLRLVEGLSPSQFRKRFREERVIVWQLETTDHGLGQQLMHEKVDALDQKDENYEQKKAMLLSAGKRRAWQDNYTAAVGLCGEQLRREQFVAEWTVKHAWYCSDELLDQVRASLTSGEKMRLDYELVATALRLQKLTVSPFEVVGIDKTLNSYELVATALRLQKSTVSPFEVVGIDNTLNSYISM
ncbi:unnamed protein product [Amoebophrya sp. A120]|nr:unnamed protein product [Amoebophrya sp. A120]|eukprot:GSA120T00003661001.1